MKESTVTYLPSESGVTIEVRGAWGECQVDIGLAHLEGMIAAIKLLQQSDTRASTLTDPTTEKENK